MKVEELKKLKEDTLKKMAIAKGALKVTVGTATCGLAAGAKPVLTELEAGIKKNGLKNVSLVQVGCNGRCTFEPLVEVINEDGTKIVYSNVNSDIAKEIVESHLVKKEVVQKHVMTE